MAPPVEADSTKAECIIAFDYGTRFIGIAVGQSITRTASPLAALPAKDGTPNWDQVAALLKEWQPQRLVVGLPLNMDGTPSDMSQRAEKFAKRLHGRYGLPVEMSDERLSSFEARGEMLSRDRGNRDFRGRGVDSESARLILEGWFGATATDT